MHARKVTAEDEDLIRLQICDELRSECRTFSAIEDSIYW